MATVTDGGRGSVTSSRGTAESTSPEMNIRGAAAPRGSYKTDGTYGRGGSSSGNFQGRTEYGRQRVANSGSGRFQNWWCPCGNENYERRTQCNWCKKPKPEQGPMVGVVESRSPYNTLQVTGTPNRPQLYQQIVEPFFIDDDDDWDVPAPADARKSLDVVDAGASKNAPIKNEESKTAKVSKGPGREWNCPDSSCNTLNGIDKWQCTVCNLSAPPWPEDK